MVISAPYSLIVLYGLAAGSGYSLTERTVPVSTVFGNASIRIFAFIPTRTLSILDSLILANTCIRLGSGKRTMIWRSRTSLPSAMSGSRSPPTGLA
jgi:hypothetical protein